MYVCMYNYVYVCMGIFQGIFSSKPMIKATTVYCINIMETSK